jgi:hypothetical protein
MAELDKALEIFGLDKFMFNQMKKSELKVFIQLATQPRTGSFLKDKYGKVLLDAKSKRVSIQEPEKIQIVRSSSINFDYCAPTSASIDILFTSLVSSNTSNTFI